MEINDEDGLPQGRMLTEEESLEMKENLAQRNSGMSLAEFTAAWKAWRVRRRLRASRKGYRAGEDTSGVLGRARRAARLLARMKIASATIIVFGL